MSKSNRRGSSQNVVLALLGSVVVLGGLIAFLIIPANSPSPSNSNGGTAGGTKQTEPLIVYVAASNKAVVETIAAKFTKETNIPVQLQFGASQSLLAGLEVSRTGDLYLPADDSYLTAARKKGLIQEVFPLAHMTAVVAVAKGNPLEIKTLADLLHTEGRLVQGSAEATAIGNLTQQALTATEQWEPLAKKTIAFKTTVNDAANDVRIGAADAAIIWDAVGKQYPELETVSIPELSKIKANVAVSVLASSKQPTATLRFARYLAAADRGLIDYQQAGFEVVAGDPWEATPEVVLYAGSMLRPAIEETITEFEKREGVRVIRSYNGCGILVGMMQAGNIPDAYFACDQEFMSQVKDKFPESAALATNQLVILVQKGNPHKIASLKDLTKPGLKVGIGHEKQCAMGWLTQRTLAEGGLKTEVMANVTVQTPSGDMLVNQMRAGSLDAAVAYLSNAAGAADYLDAILIQGLPCAIATQPYGIAGESKHRQAATRLLEAIRSTRSQERFQKEGFQWKGEGTTATTGKAETTAAEAGASPQ